jgi:cold-inducible RNA-binding protein
MTSIYVGNLTQQVSENDLREAFEAYGAVSTVTLIKDRETGQPRGFAFVEMPDATAAANAIKELNLREIGGRSVTVNQARPKTERPRGGGGGGGGRSRKW